MRKRTISNLADTIFWYLVYLLPVIGYLFYLIAEPSSGTILVSFESFFTNIGLGLVSDNVVVSTLKDIFGTGGVLPLFTTDTPFIIFGWFVCTFITHLAVDSLLFIPRLAHKWMNKFTQGD